MSKYYNKQNKEQRRSIIVLIILFTEITYYSEQHTVTETNVYRLKGANSNVIGVNEQFMLYIVTVILSMSPSSVSV